MKIELQKECFVSLSSEQSYKQLLDYFFVVWKPGDAPKAVLVYNSRGLYMPLARLMRFNISCSPGMTFIDFCSDTPIDCSTPCHMTNSVNVADGLKLCEMEKTRASDMYRSDDFSGELVLCKVLVGVTEETSSSKMLVLVDRVGHINFSVHMPCGRG